MTRLYAPFMRLVHRWGWHYAPLQRVGQHYHRRCDWCGFHETFEPLHEEGMLR